MRTCKPSVYPPIKCSKDLFKNEKLYPACTKIKDDGGFCQNSIKPNTVCFFWNENKTVIQCAAAQTSQKGNLACPGEQVACYCRTL